MDTEKAWEEFQANDSSIRKSESVQQDIQQILDTVTQIKTDVDQLKGENTEATGPVDTEPALSAPENNNQPPMAPPTDMSGAAPGGEIPQEPMGDLMAQPEDGAATPTPEPIPTQGEIAAEAMGTAPQADMEDPFMFGEEESDEDKLLEAAMSIEDPNLKQQIIALVYQAIEEKKGGAMVPPVDMPMEAPPAEMGATPGPEEILEAIAGGDIGSMMPPDDTSALMRSATESVECDVNPAKLTEAKPTTAVQSSMTTKEGDNHETNNIEADDVSITVKNSEDENKEEEESDKKKDDNDKSERPEKEEPGVNDGLPSKEEDKDSIEELPEVTEVKIESKEEDIDEPESDEVDDETMRAIDDILEEAKEKIKEQVLDKDDSSPFLLSTSEMMKSRRAGGSHRAFRTGPVTKSIPWPDSFEGVSLEDKCRLFAKSFSQMSEDMQDRVVTLMDDVLSAGTTEQIFKSEGVDLDAYYEPIMKGDFDNQPYTSQNANTTDNETSTDKGEGMTEPTKESKTVEECNDSDSVKKSKGSYGELGTETLYNKAMEDVPDYVKDGISPNSKTKEKIAGNIIDQNAHDQAEYLRNYDNRSQREKNIEDRKKFDEEMVTDSGITDSQLNKVMTLVDDMTANGMSKEEAIDAIMNMLSGVKVPQISDASAPTAGVPALDVPVASNVQYPRNQTPLGNRPVAKIAEPMKRSADVGMHIPSVSEMMSFKKSGTSMYTAMSREAAEPHGIVKMEDEPEIPSVKDMFAKRFGKV